VLTTCPWPAATPSRRRTSWSAWPRPTAKLRSLAHQPLGSVWLLAVLRHGGCCCGGGWRAWDAHPLSAAAPWRHALETSDIARAV
jgi:hypothetical protein